MRYRRHLSLVRTALAVCIAWTFTGVPVQADTCADILADTCTAKPDFPPDVCANTQEAIDGFSWQTFLALANAGDSPQWKSWYSTPDMLEPVYKGGTPHAASDTDPPGTATSDTRYYPSECQSVENYSQYRVLDEVGKVDDAFLRGQVTGPVCKSRHRQEWDLSPIRDHDQPTHL
jgi:hypothetical protein